MATPDNVTARPNSLAGSLENELRDQVNNLTASLRLLTAKLDADGDLTATDFAEVVTDDTNASAPAIIDVPGF